MIPRVLGPCERILKGRTFHGECMPWIVGLPGGHESI